ncbi:MAG: aquaporin [Chloroflexi bacterium]|nr:aquaporin [Chloroflexota bacterium]
MSALKSIWQPSIAELIATFTFVFVGVGAAGASTWLGTAPGDTGLILVGLAHGLGIMIGVMTVGRISGGHLNPAVSVAAWATGNIGTPRLIAYVIAQLAGATLAAIALDRAFNIDGLGVHKVRIETGTAFGLEAILTFFLVFAVFALAIDPRGNKTWAPFAIGTVIALDHFIAIPLTGASMNPARSFGPALVHGEWADHWVYWAGPIAGGIVAAVVYVRLFGDDTLRKRANNPFKEQEGG